MYWYINALTKKYFCFTGRARREEFWMFVLFNLLASILAGMVDGILGTAFLGVTYAVLTIIPGVAVSVRRLHDTNRTGWWYLILLLPLIGLIVFLIFAILEGTSGDNDYGEDAKLIDRSA